MLCHACGFPLARSERIVWPSCQPIDHHFHAACLAEYIPTRNAFAHLRNHGDAARFEHAQCPICRATWGQGAESTARIAQLVDSIGNSRTAMPQHGCPCLRYRQAGAGPDTEAENADPYGPMRDHQQPAAPSNVVCICPRHPQGAMQWLTSRTLSGYRCWWICNNCEVELAAADAPLPTNNTQQPVCPCRPDSLGAWILQATNGSADTWVGGWQCSTCNASLHDAPCPQGIPSPLALPPGYTPTAVSNVRAFLTEQLHALMARGYEALSNTTWSAVLSPWIWFAAADSDDMCFVELLAIAASELPAGVCSLACNGPDAIRRAFLQTRSYLRLNEVLDASTLVAYFDRSLPHVTEWARQDSRFQGIAISRNFFPRRGGQYFQDYLQEFVLHGSCRVAGARGTVANHCRFSWAD